MRALHLRVGAEDQLFKIPVATVTVKFKNGHKPTISLTNLPVNTFPDENASDEIAIKGALSPSI